MVEQNIRELRLLEFFFVLHFPLKFLKYMEWMQHVEQTLKSTIVM